MLSSGKKANASVSGLVATVLYSALGIAASMTGAEGQQTSLASKSAQFPSAGGASAKVTIMVFRTCAKATEIWISAFQVGMLSTTSPPGHAAGGAAITR